MSGQLTVTVTTLPGVMKKYSLRTQSSRAVREGQQVAVNLEKERVIIHLKKSSMTVCGSLGCRDQPCTSRRKEELKALHCSLASQRCRFTTWICATSDEDRKCLTYVLLSVPTLQNVRGGRKLQYQKQWLQMQMFMSEDVKFWKCCTLTAF